MTTDRGERVGSKNLLTYRRTQRFERLTNLGKQLRTELRTVEPTELQSFVSTFVRNYYTTQIDAGKKFSVVVHEITAATWQACRHQSRQTRRDEITTAAISGLVAGIGHHAVLTDSLASLDMAIKATGANVEELRITPVEVSSSIKKQREEKLSFLSRIAKDTSLSTELRSQAELIMTYSAKEMIDQKCQTIRSKVDAVMNEQRADAVLQSLWKHNIPLERIIALSEEVTSLQELKGRIDGSKEIKSESEVAALKEAQHELWRRGKDVAIQGTWELIDFYRSLGIKSIENLLTRTGMGSIDSLQSSFDAVITDKRKLTHDFLSAQGLTPKTVDIWKAFATTQEGYTEEAGSREMEQAAFDALKLSEQQLGILVLSNPNVVVDVANRDEKDPRSQVLSFLNSKGDMNVVISLFPESNSASLKSHATEEYFHAAHYIVMDKAKSRGLYDEVLGHFGPSNAVKEALADFWVASLAQQSGSQAFEDLLTLRSTAVGRYLISSFDTLFTMAERRQGGSSTPLTVAEINQIDQANSTSYKSILEASYGFSLGHGGEARSAHEPLLYGGPQDPASYVIGEAYSKAMAVSFPEKFGSNWAETNYGKKALEVVMELSPVIRAPKDVARVVNWIASTNKEHPEAITDDQKKAFIKQLLTSESQTPA
ncbi:MAG: hypothetical protein WCP97_03430 [bacterium]